MTTRDDIVDVIDRIERAGYAGAATRAAQIDLLLLPPQHYQRILDRLRAAYPELVPQPARLPAPPRDPVPDRVPGQHGAAAQAMKNAETALAQQQSATAEFDRQVITALLHAHKTTGDGRRRLDDLQTQIESISRAWDLSTPTGAREFQRFLITKLAQIVEVVQEANDDDTSKRALAAAWAALYAAGADEAAVPGRESTPDSAPGPGVTPAAPDRSGMGMDLYPDAFPDDQPLVGAADMPGPGGPRAPVPPILPVAPGLDTPPAAGGFLPGNWAPNPRPTGSATGSDDLRVPDSAMSPADASVDQLDDRGADDDRVAAPEAPPAGPVTVTLPDGETITVATPQLAAVIRAAADGTPVADAFRQQGITIPPPGTPVVGPLDQSQVGPGDVGMFTDRHALALGSSKALLDGQIQQIDNVRGPSFLGWQHPPIPGPATAAPPAPSPTRPSATVRV